MNSPAPGDPNQLTRQQRILLDWVRIGRIPRLGTPAAAAKLRRVASRPGDDVRLSIGDLDDRQAMLYDFRARVSFLKRDLAALLEAVPREPLPSQSSTP